MVETMDFFYMFVIKPHWMLVTSALYHVISKFNTTNVNIPGYQGKTW